MKNNTMNVFLYMMLGLFAGMASPIQTSINSELRNALQSPFIASLISFLVGMVILLFLTSIIEHRRLFHLNNLHTAKTFITAALGGSGLAEYLASSLSHPIFCFCRLSERHLLLFWL